MILTSNLAFTQSAEAFSGDSSRAPVFAL